MSGTESREVREKSISRRDQSTGHKDGVTTSLQSLDKTINIDSKKAENDSWKIWTNGLRDLPVFAIM